MYSVIIFSSCLVMVSSYPSYADLIPNGKAVPDPCPNKQEPFLAVGHWGSAPQIFSFTFDQAHSAAFERNPFGMDFEQKLRQWSQVCKLDSDGDGRTNGEELGDPNCVWQEGTKPAGPATSHPGIAEVFNGTNVRIKLRVLSKVDCSSSQVPVLFVK